LFTNLFAQETFNQQQNNTLPRTTTHQSKTNNKAMYRTADLIVPCNASFNTGWELWLGTPPARLMPLLNALEIEHYPLLQDAEAPRPTASMLSHVYGGCGGGGNAMRI
jgi:hypothetical protein